MKRITVCALFILAFLICVPHAAASDLAAPVPPHNALIWMPDSQDDPGIGILQVIQKIVPFLKVEIVAALKLGFLIFAGSFLISILQSWKYYTSVEIAGTLLISTALIQNSHLLISLATETIVEISEYSKLFLPVITALYAAQGAFTSSSALCIGTTVFTSFLCNILSRIMLPCLSLFQAVVIAQAATEDTFLRGLKSAIKGCTSWFLKSALAVFLTYMGITQVLTGSADRAALKATKAAIKTFVPVIGGSLADTSEAILISTSIAKNAVGIYGIFAFLAIVISPFFKISAQYIALKITAFLCSIPGTKRINNLISDFSYLMGLLLGMTGVMCALSVIGTMCFLKGME